MRCTACGNLESKVIDSRPSEDNSSIRRRRECLACGHRFTTYERMTDCPLMVIKADNSSEVFHRTKLMHGLIIACAKRHIAPSQLDQIADEIENSARNKTKSEISSREIGSLVMQHLAKIDVVAYIRFASVYKKFDSIQEFSDIVKGLSS